VFAGAMVGPDLDPYKTAGAIGGIIDMYDPLIRPQVDLTLAPGLATKWEWSADNLTLRLTLREGVTFSDGTPFDSSSVVASLDRARSGQTSLEKVNLATITDVRSDGPNAAVLTVSRPDPTLLNTLAGMPGMMINPKLINDESAIRSGAKGVGTGPYVLESYQPSTRSVLVKRADYWDAASIPHAPARFEFDYVLDGNARLNGLKSGQYQGVQYTGTPNLIGPGALPTVDDRFRNSVRPSFNTMAVAFMFTAPFDDPLVRQAVVHAINFEALVPGVLADQMGCDKTPAWQVPMPNQIGYNPDLKGPAYNLDQAKQLLAQAGYPDGKGLPPITLASSMSSQDVVAGQAIQAELAKIGIQATLNSQPSRVYVVAQLSSGKANMATINLNAGGGIDPSLGYNTGVLANPAFVDLGTPQGAQYKDLVGQASRTPATDQRAALYRQAESIAAQNAFYVPFCRQNNGYATTSKIGGFVDSYWTLKGAVKASAVTVTT